MTETTFTHDRKRVKFANRGARQFVALAFMILFIGACSKPAPETRLENAGEKLDESVTELRDLNARIADTESTLDRLRDERRNLKDRVRTLEERLAARATEIAIFRSVQSALLAESSLQSTAISVSVDDRTVILGGNIDSEEKKKKALEITQNTAGVENVTSRLRLKTAAAATTN